MWIAGGRGTGGNVVSMAGRAGDRAPDHPALARLWDYWQSLRRPGALPGRSMVDPRQIEDVLEFAFIAERIAPGELRLRLAGMHLAGLFGAEVRGMPLSAFILPEARGAVAANLEAAFAGPAAVVLSLESPSGLGCPRLRAGLVLLPLADERGLVSRVLGGLAAEGSVGRSPRRFRLLAARSMPCPSALAADPPSAPPDEAAPRAQAPGPWRGTPAPHLRLVHTSP